MGANGGCFLVEAGGLDAGMVGGMGDMTRGCRQCATRAGLGFAVCVAGVGCASQDGREIAAAPGCSIPAIRCAAASDKGWSW